MSEEFQDQLPDDLQGHRALEDFSSIGDLAKSFIDTQSKIGGMVSLPQNEADLGEFYNRMGRPETHDGYQLPVDDSGQTYFDDDSVDDFKRAAHSLGLTDSQAAGVFNYLSGDLAERDVGAANGLADEIDNTEAVLKTEWGIHFDTKVGNIQNALHNFFGEDEREVMEQIVASNPGFAKSMAAIGASISEGNGVQGGPPAPLTRSELRNEIDRHLQDDEGAYRNRNHRDHKKTVELVSGLYKQLHDE